MVQALLATNPDRVSHLVLIGTNPPGQLVKTSETIFYETAAKAVNDDADQCHPLLRAEIREEPRGFQAVSGADSAAQRTGSASRSQSNLHERIWGLAPAIRCSRPARPRGPQGDQHSNLHIGGGPRTSFSDRRTGYALNQQLKTLQLLTFPTPDTAPNISTRRSARDAIASSFVYLKI